jgi:hypothetical protein
LKELTADEKLKIAEEEIITLCNLIDEDADASVSVWDQAERIRELIKFGWRVI